MTESLESVTEDERAKRLDRERRNTFVKLPGGWVVPARFDWAGQVVMRRRGVDLEVTIDMVGGQPRLLSLTIEAEEPLRPSEMSRLRSEDIIDLAVRATAELPGKVQRRGWMLDMGEGRDNPDEPLGRLQAKCLEPAGPVAAAMRRRIDHEFLAEVVEIYERDGVPAVMTEMNATERNARRWLARAREAGLR